MKIVIPDDIDDDIGGYIVDWVKSKNKNPGIWELSIGKPKRTNKQNNSIHKYCDMVAEELNNAGHPFTFKPFSKELFCAWNRDLVKEHIWKPIQVAILGKSSTTKLKTGEVQQVYNVLSQHLSENFEIFLPFPSE